MNDVVLYDHAASICSQMARLALVEKGVAYRRHSIDIMQTNEQFEPWYVALNPRAVVPTLKVGDEVTTDTIRIVGKVQQMPGPDLSGDDSMADWLRKIMALHYGVLLYRNRLESDGTARQIVARGKFLEQLRIARPDLEKLVATRLEGNIRFQKLLQDSAGIQTHIDAARSLVSNMADALSDNTYLAGPSYSLADCFATAALARFTIHGFSPWWLGTALEEYYRAMKARPSFAEAGVLDTGTERDI